MCQFYIVHIQNFLHKYIFNLHTYYVHIRISVYTGIQITAPSPQQLFYHTNGTIECSSVNDTIPVWHTVVPEVHINDNATYTVEDGGLDITNVQLYHHQRYKCEHVLASNAFLARSVIIDVEILGKKIGM